ncbi:MAG: 2-phospho-L-lactate guanylyltransferase [Solirubrobacterales bacterium]|nr:2-phospho-L-lactate guanylyltransferase [Solirubrobacterales bacterium]
MRTAAILPVKRFVDAKQRLGASVADDLRLELAEAMVTDVLEALEQTAAIEQTIVVTCEQAILDVAGELGAIVIADRLEEGQSAAVSLGIERALGAGIERALCVPGDCPALDPDELETLLGLAGSNERDESAGPAVVIVPDRHGTGTNGLLLCPPGAIAPSFGADSCERHQTLARAAGVSWTLEQPSSLLLDIDTGADLAELRARLMLAPARAERTRAVLGRTHAQTPPAARG